MKSLITVDDLYPDEENEDPDNIAVSIEAELKEFFNKEIRDKSPSIIIAIERKGWNLFRPYLKNIAALHAISRIKHFIHLKSKRLLFYTSIHGKEEIVILTDAIGDGNEVIEILDDKNNLKLFCDGKEVTRVCSYLATSDGSDNIKKKYPEVELKILKPVETKEEYQKEQKRLLYVYQNRMDPMDGEHPYVILKSSKSNIELETVKEIIRSTIPSFYTGEFQIVDDHLKIKNKKSITVHFFDENAFLVRFDKIFKNKLQFEKMALRLRFSKSESLLRIMGLGMTIHERTIFYFLTHLIWKCNENIPFKGCEKYFNHRYLPIWRPELCPMCIDNNISRFLVSVFIQNAEKNPIYSEYDFKVIETDDGI